MAPRFIIGLTGNIASGKSAVASMLTAMGADVVDADRVAHEVLAAGTEETRAVAARFGSGVLRDDGSVDRTRLGAIVFGDPVALAALEEIVHPGTRRRILGHIAASKTEVGVIEAIKLLEGPLVDRVHAVWVVIAPREARIRRLVQQRGMSAEDAAQRVDAQNPEEDKVARADVIIRNDGTLADLRSAVQGHWNQVVEVLRSSDR